MMNAISEAQQKAYLHGYIDGLRAFAWWKDGTQYVGTCGTTLNDAIAKAEAEFEVVLGKEGEQCS